MLLKSVDYVVVHCADTPPTMDIGWTEIDQWHRAQGWRAGGYHYVIRRDGTLEKGRDELTQGAHVRGHNHHSLAICLVGGRKAKDPGDPNEPEDNFTDEQKGTLWGLVEQLKRKYPDAQVVGHRDLDSRKDCPSFDVGKQWRLATGRPLA